MSFSFSDICECGHQRQLHEFPQWARQGLKKDQAADLWNKRPIDPGCRVGHEKFIRPKADGVSTVPHGGKLCLCEVFKEATK